MIKTWSEETKSDRTTHARKDPPMFDLTPTSCKVNDLFIRESLAKAEQYHALTRDVAPATKQSATKAGIQMPRISVFRRLTHLVLRPA